MLWRRCNVQISHTVPLLVTWAPVNCHFSARVETCTCTVEYCMSLLLSTSLSAWPCTREQWEPSSSSPTGDRPFLAKMQREKMSSCLRVKHQPHPARFCLSQRRHALHVETPAFRSCFHSTGVGGHATEGALKSHFLKWLCCPGH